MEKGGVRADRRDPGSARPHHRDLRGDLRDVPGRLELPHVAAVERATGQTRQEGREASRNPEVFLIHPPRAALGAYEVHLNCSIGRASAVVVSATRPNCTTKSAAVTASGASKITRASGFPRRPRNSWIMMLFGIFGCLNVRVASSSCPGMTLSCVTKSMAPTVRAYGDGL